MEAERHANRQTNRRDRLPGEVLGIEDDDVAEVAFRVVDIGHDPAFVLGGGSRLPHEDRLRCHPARTIVMDLGRLALQVVLHRRAERHVLAPVRGVEIAIGVPAVTPIDPREFVAAVVQHRLGQSPGRAMERPPHQDGRAFIGSVLIGEKHAPMPRQVDDGEITVVVGVGEVKGEAARRFEPLDARRHRRCAAEGRCGSPGARPRATGRSCGNAPAERSPGSRGR